MNYSITGSGCDTGTLPQIKACLLAAFSFLACAASLMGVETGTNAGSFPVHISVNAGNPVGALRPIWRFFGADEPNYATLKNGRKLIAELGELSPQQVYFRAHNLLTSGDGTPALKWGSTDAYKEDATGKPIYNWSIVDGIFEVYLQRGVRPYVEIGFMPEALSTHPEPYQHHWTPTASYEQIYTGWAYPPKDYQKWEELVYQWTRHCVEKFGRQQVESWYWEVWNEANIGYWRGTRQEFLKLHDHAINGVKRALPTARVGGPDCAGDGGSFTSDFLTHCLQGTNFATGQVGTPVDFISFHAKGSPVYTNGHVRMGIANQLRTVRQGFRNVAGVPALKNKPIIIGESDPEGCAACQGASLAYRNGTMYSSYTAASFARKLDLADELKVNFEGALTWAFEFEDQPYFAGFRSLASGGLDKPVLNVFRMFSRMQGSRVEASSDHAIALEQILRLGVRQDPDVSTLVSASSNKLSVLVWHYHDDDVSGPVAEVELIIQGFKLMDREVVLRHFRIDEEHSNAFSTWKRMGSPQQPSAGQYGELEESGKLAFLEPESKLPIHSGRASLKFKLPRQAVSLLELSWE